MEYVITLFWLVEAIGLALLIIAIILITYTLGKSAKEKVEIKGTKATN